MVFNKASVRLHAGIYLAGLTISAFGSLGAAAAMPALLLRAAVPIAFIGVLIGSLRLNTFLVNALLGQIGDRFSPRNVMIFCELGAAAGSLLILVSWQQFGASWLLPFFFANNVRVFFTALQASSVQKYGKLFDERLGLNGGMAVRLNGATNGVLLLAGLLSVYFFDRLTLEAVFLVDFGTFVLNGLLLILLQRPQATPTQSALPRSTNTTLGYYYQLLPGLFVLDVLLSLVLCGANTLNLRLLANAPDLVPIAPALFGGAALLSTFLSKGKPNFTWLWIALGTTLLLQGFLVDHPIVIIGLSALRNLFYWLIYQAISREFMRQTAAENYASASAGRSAISVMVLAGGEFWVGLTAKASILIEMGWRALVAFVAPNVANRLIKRA